jgi:hypothetical protein
VTETLSEMCGLAGLAMERATRALLQADLAIGEAVISDHEHLARMQTGIAVAADDLDGIGGDLHGGIGGDEFGDAGLAAVGAAGVPKPPAIALTFKSASG